MPNVHLTKPMQEFANDLKSSGAYANLSEIVRAGMRHLMEKDRVRAFHALKAELNEAAEAVARGEFIDFDPREFEPDAFP